MVDYKVSHQRTLPSYLDAHYEEKINARCEPSQNCSTPTALQNYTKNIYGTMKEAYINICGANMPQSDFDIFFFILVIYNT